MSKEKTRDWKDFKADICPMCANSGNPYTESIVFEKKGAYKIIKRAFTCEKCGEKWEACKFETP